MFSNPGVVPESLDCLLSREAAARALTAAGYVTSPSTLATKATRGNGPGYRIFGKRAIYRWGDLLAWAESRATPVRRSTSEAFPCEVRAGIEQNETISSKRAEPNNIAVLATA
jgi:hypothetical protein